MKSFALFVAIPAWLFLIGNAAASEMKCITRDMGYGHHHKEVPTTTRTSTVTKHETTTKTVHPTVTATTWHTEKKSSTSTVTVEVSTTSMTTTTTSEVTTTVPAATSPPTQTVLPPGFVPVDQSIQGVSPRRRFFAFPRGGKKQYYLGSVDCLSRTTITSTKTETSTVGPTVTTYESSTTTNTVFPLTTTTRSENLVARQENESTTTTSTSVSTETSTSTATSASPTPTVVTQCTQENIAAKPVNGTAYFNAAFYTNTDGLTTLQSEAASPYDCCRQCELTSNCAGSSYTTSTSMCQVMQSTQDSCAAGQDSYTMMIDTSILLTEPQIYVSNGPCSLARLARQAAAKARFR